MLDTPCASIKSSSISRFIPLFRSIKSFVDNLVFISLALLLVIKGLFLWINLLNNVIAIATYFILSATRSDIEFFEKYIFFEWGLSE